MKELILNRWCKHCISAIYCSPEASTNKSKVYYLFIEVILCTDTKYFIINIPEMYVALNLSLISSLNLSVNSSLNSQSFTN